MKTMKSLTEEPHALDLFHGVPQHEWIGRTIKGHAVGKSRPPVKVIAFHSNERIEIRPVNHGHNEIVSFRDVHPWWSRNDDLRTLYKVEESDSDETDILEKFSKSLTTGTSLADAFVAKEKAAPEIPDGYVSIPTPPSVNPPVTPSPAPAKRVIRRISADPTGDLAWMDDLKTFNEARNGKEVQHGIIEAALKELKHLDELEQLCIRNMEDKGVVIEWEGDAPATPVQETRPVRVGETKKAGKGVKGEGPGKAEFLKLFRERAVPGKWYTSADVARCLDLEMGQLVCNRLSDLSKEGLVVKEIPEGETRLHYKLP